MKTKIIIDLTEILNRVYAESARHALCQPDALVLTPDQNRLLTGYLEAGFQELCVRMGGYVALHSFNPHAESANVQLHLSLRWCCGERVATLLQHAIVELLANYALMRVYGDDGTCYGTAWRKHRAQALLVLARDQAHLGPNGWC